MGRNRPLPDLGNLESLQVNPEISSLPFDMVERYRVAQEVLRLCHESLSPSPLDLLDVGGVARGSSGEFLTPLSLFLPGERVRTVDLQEAPGVNYSRCDGTALPFRDGAFDGVLSFDVLEHVPPEKRRSFFEELVRSTRGFLLLTTPVSSPEVEGAEELVERRLEASLGIRQEQLREHRAHGLPEAGALEELFRSEGMEFLSVESGELDLWVVTLLLRYYWLSSPGGVESVNALDRHLNLGNRPLFLRERGYRRVFLGVKPPFASLLKSFKPLVAQELNRAGEGGKSLNALQALLQRETEKVLEEYLVKTRVLEREKAVLQKTLQEQVASKEGVERSLYALVPKLLPTTWEELPDRVQSLSPRIFTALLDLWKIRRALPYYGERLLSSLRGQAALPVASSQERPLFSVVMPVYNIDPRFLKEAVDSVLEQRDPRWELCIAEDASPREDVRVLLREYEARDPRIRVNYLPENHGMVGAYGKALEMARGEYAAFLDHDDRLHPDALLRVAQALERWPDFDLLFTDEDKLTPEGKREDPVFKPGWRPDLLLRYNYLCHLVVCRLSLIRQVGGFREGFEGSQDYDLWLRVTEKTERVMHISQVLYHWRRIPGSAAAKVDAKPVAFESSRKALQEALLRRGILGRVEMNARPGLFNIVSLERSLFQPPQNLSLHDAYLRFLSRREREERRYLGREDLYSPGPPSETSSQEILSLLSPLCGRTHLDVGCGLGLTVQALEREGRRAVGLDVAFPFLREAKGRASLILQGDAQNLPFREGSFETVSLTEVLEHLEDPERALAEAARVAQRGVIVTVPNLDPLPECAWYNVIMHQFFDSSHRNFFTSSMLRRFLQDRFPYVRVIPFGRFFTQSGSDLFYHLLGIGSREPL